LENVFPNLGQKLRKAFAAASEFGISGHDNMTIQQLESLPIANLPHSEDLFDIGSTVVIFGRPEDECNHKIGYVSSCDEHDYSYLVTLKTGKTVLVKHRFLRELPGSMIPTLVSTGSNKAKSDGIKQAILPDCGALACCLASVLSKEEWVQFRGICIHFNLFCQFRSVDKIEMRMKPGDSTWQVLENASTLSQQDRTFVDLVLARLKR